MNIASIALRSLGLKAKMFEASTKHPIKAQWRVLSKYLARNKRTEYGRKYDFASIKSMEGFRSRVPLCDYKKIKPYIDRMKKGEGNVLTSDKVIFFGITSGTTGQPKLIPVTGYSRRRKADAMKLWAYYVYRDHPSVVSDRILAIISPEVKNYTEAGIPYGPEDGHAYNNLPNLIKRLYVIPYEVFYINDYDARYYCILRIAMEKSITTIATLNPSTLILLCQRIDALKERIIEDIEKGTLDKGLDIPVEIRCKVEAKLRPNPKRAGELRAVLKNNKEFLPKHFWPRMELIECWKGGTVKLYLKELTQYFGGVTVRDFGCLSTEARSSVPMSDEGAGGVLAINANFYEFIPVEEMDKDNPKTLLCDQLEKEKKYLLVVTTPAGLYRYNIDDVVVVDGFFNKTPVIEFVQKGHNAISLTGEKIYESHVDEAVNRAAAANKLAVKYFTASIQMDNPPRYIFLVEFEKDVPGEDKKRFLVSVEKGLFCQNSEYEDIRRQQLLAPPILKVVRKGDFERYRAACVKKGAHDTQFKLLELNGHPDFQNNFNIEEEIRADDEQFFRAQEVADV